MSILKEGVRKYEVGRVMAGRLWLSIPYQVPMFKSQKEVGEAFFILT